MNLSIKENQLIALKGRSGSGKTTLLNLIGALDRPTNGEIYFHGEPLSLLNTKQQAEYRRTKLGFIFQSHGLVPLMTVEENIEFGLRVTGAPREEWDSRVQEAIDVVGLTNRAKHRPYELSGGEQQRVAIARAISTEPSLILADEPTAELNSTMAYQIVQVFKKLVNEKKTTMILTTHDPAIMEMLDYVYTLEDGRIE
ncbi:MULTISPECIES: ABC transporter ATP-binding protein [Metabacillus]|uniref:ABC transporter ATP-binding protein n=1 Tax=Metabacillus TaxID=2675233 RepID=UPI0021AB1893|nr:MULTISPECIES: ABC transporter ATP-binding protein [Metabacillus]